MAKEIILFHGTEVTTAEKDGDIYGYLLKENPDSSAGLTDDFETAREFALRKAHDDPQLARIIEIKLPKSKAKKVGGVAHFAGDSYITTDRVSAKEVSVDYLRRTPFPNKMLAEEMEKEEIIQFYRVKRENVVNVHKLGK